MAGRMVRVYSVVRSSSVFLMGRAREREAG